MCEGAFCNTDENCLTGWCSGHACSDSPKPPEPTPEPHHGPDTLLWLWIILGIVAAGLIIWLVYYLI